MRLTAHNMACNNINQIRRTDNYLQLDTYLDKIFSIKPGSHTIYFHVNIVRWDRMLHCMGDTCAVFVWPHQPNHFNGFSGAYFDVKVCEIEWYGSHIFILNCEICDISHGDPFVQNSYTPYSVYFHHWHNESDRLSSNILLWNRNIIASNSTWISTVCISHCRILKMH